LSNVDRLNGLVLEAQQDIFRLACRDCGLTLKAISDKANIPYQNVKLYAGGHNAMPIVALLKLRGVIPDSLLSLVLAPVDAQIVSTLCADDAHDDFAERCDNVASLVRKARHPDSPEGVEIAECEAHHIRRARAECGA
jgi:hypothetical protein